MTSNQLSTLAVPRNSEPASLDESTGGTMVILRWGKESGWAWLAHGRGAVSPFVGFLRLADPVTLPTTIRNLGWELVSSREISLGLVESEIRIPLTGANR